MDSDWTSGRDLLLRLDSGRGLRTGIEQSLREAMRDGRLVPGAALPSSRSLARDLGVARGTVSAAYSQLAAEGYLDIRQGAPVRAVWQPRYRPAPVASPAQAACSRWDLRPCLPESGSFPRQAWARAQRQVLGHAPDEAFGYGDPLGSTRLRQVLAEYLGRTRGVDTDPASLLICTGFTQAFTLICHVLHAKGIANLAVEDPSDPRYRRIAHGVGLSVTPVPCDRDGLQVAKLTRSRARAVLITPAHQFPLGVTMSATRRTALVEWARHRQALIIEDDYDGEFRYDRQPVGALQALDPGHVIYGGTVSKTLAPGLRLGWLSLPGSLIGTFRAAKDDLDRCTGVMEQLAFAELIASGAFDQHVRRMRTRYRHRRDELAQAFAATRPDLRLSGISAGLHALVYLSGQESSEQQILARATRHSIALHTLGSYWHSLPEPCPQAVIIGYAAPASHAFRPALRALAQVLAAP